MGKVLKVLFGLLLLLVVLIVAAVIIVPMVVDPNDHKQEIIAEVQKATGRDLAIDGDIGLSVFPWLGLELNGLSLSNASGFGDQPFAALDHVQVRVNLVPLILQQILEVDKVQVEGLELNLAKSKSGVTNWDDLAKAGQKEMADSSVAEAPVAEKKSAGKAMGAFSIGGIEISGAHIVWDDKSTGDRFEIKDLEVKTGAMNPGQPVEFSLGLGLDSAQPALRSKVDLSGNLNADPKAGSIAVETLKLLLKVTGEGLPKDGVEAELRADLYVEQKAETLEIKNLVLESGALKMSGAVKGRGIQSAPAFNGDIKLAEFSLRQWMEKFGLPVPETADPKVLNRLGMGFAFVADQKRVALKDLQMALDETLIKGEFELIDPANPAYAFTLDIDKIDLDRYLPPKPAGEAGGSQRSSGKSAKEEPLFPVEMLRKLDLDGTLRVGSIKANNIRAEAIQVKVNSKGGKLNIDQKVGRFYDGALKGTVDLDVRGKTPKLKIKQSASGIQAGPLVVDVSGQDRLAGKGGFNVNLTSAGQLVSQLKKTLNGKLDFDFRDGAVKGINLAKMLRDAKAKLSGKAAAVSNEPEQTDFAELSASAVVRNGVLDNRDLLAKSPFLRVEGSGKVNIVAESLDYTVKPVIVSTGKGQGGEGLEELKGVPIPVHLQGSWADPQWNIDLGKVLAESQKAKLKGKLDEKLKEKLPGGLQDKLPGALKGLF
ncbi:MAG: AsmA family protein [gamma proteobacterium endosymbiont of Lamellibrachia anaximandri]|nr:AsmA family protein [gamma proteobacterium endosymbiont of Lamellibrachia anaximandri]MBL3532637.1 AsmA family protein [gamma proteobacterium endosymbiont of Lamellibrachia anaximandri]